LVKIKIYTDGACSNGGSWDGGAGVYVELENEKQFYLLSEKETTNNIVELKAFIFALEYINKKPEILEANIMTDSGYIVDCLKFRWYENWERNGWINAKKQPVKNKELWQKILKEKRKGLFKTINIVKVKSHSGINGNVIADKLAVKGKIEQKYKNWTEVGGINEF